MKQTFAQQAENRLTRTWNNHNWYKLSKGSRLIHNTIIVVYFTDDSIATYGVNAEDILRILRNYQKLNTYDSEKQFEQLDKELYDDINK